MQLVLFGLDVDDPLCSSFFEALLTAGRAHGVHLRWGSVRDNVLTVAMDGAVSQEDILRILESKMHSRQASLQPGSEPALPGIFSGD